MAGLAVAEPKTSLSDATMPKGLTFLTDDEQPAPDGAEAKPSESGDAPTGGSTDSQEPEGATDEDADASGETAGDEDAPAGIDFNGTTYDAETLTAALDALTNKRDWQTKQTQRDQELAAKRKTMLKVEDFVTAVRENSELADAIQEVVEEFGDPKLKDALSAVLTYDPSTIENPFETELTEHKGKLEKAQERVVELEWKAEQAQLQKVYKLSDKKVKETVDYAVDYFQKHKVGLTLDAAYKLMNYSALQEQTTNRTPRTPGKKTGASEINQPKPETTDLRKAELPKELKGKFFTSD